MSKTGKISQVMGAVVDVVFEDGHLPNIYNALDLYLRLKGEGKDKTFIRTSTRNVEYIIKVLGNRAIKLYSSSVSKVSGVLTVSKFFLQKFSTGEELIF